LEETVEEVGVDTGTCVRFFSELAEADVRDVLAHLREEAFDAAMADVRSVWHRVRHACEQRADPGAHLRTCAEHLASNWTYGEPLIADALQRGDLADAEKFVEATLSSLLGADPEEPWRPELGLVPEHRYYRPGDQRAAILRLLETWETIAAQRGRAKRAAACRLQRGLLDHPHDWPAVLEDFAAYREAAAAPAVAEELFGQWRDRAVAACAPPSDGYGAKPEVEWVGLLIEARRDPAAQRDRFVKHVRAWLDGCPANAGVFRKHWRSLALLTRTLPPAEKIKDQYPAFWEHVLLPASSIETKLLASLAEALAFLGDATAGLDPLPVWREHLHELVPSPAGSSYDGPARWMKALSELVPDRYASVLAGWKTEFKRRRNLWAEMRSMECPGL
jgi:hypothetical protein